jgi:hypothetical protein
VYTRAVTIASEKSLDFSEILPKIFRLLFTKFSTLFKLPQDYVLHKVALSKRDLSVFKVIKQLYG